MKTTSYLEQLRQVALKEMTETKTTSNSNKNENEFYPEENKPVKIRILPRFKEDGTFEYPYVTHSYHYLEKGFDGEKDIKLFVPRKVFSKEVNAYINDPIDDRVAEMYKTGTDAIKTFAGKIKRKRSFYFNALVYTEDGKPELKVLIDNSSDGKLASRICSIMGIPFCKDTQDRWFPDKKWEYDPDATYFDLVDIEEGFDLKIIKKKNGINPWDISYDQTFPVANKGARALSAEDKKVMYINGQHIGHDLNTYVKYVNSYDDVMKHFNLCMTKANIGNGSSNTKPETQTSELPITKVKKPEVTVAATPDDFNEDELKAQLLADED
jgi:hypothetical protein